MDQDDSMLSTPSSHGNDDTLDEESLFPASTNNANSSSAYIAAETPQNDHLNASAPGELSPPRSPSASNADTNGFDASTAIPVDDDELTEDEGVDTKGSQLLQDDRSKPGSGWKNKKAQEEIQRTWEYITDRDFDIKQYGDPLVGQQ